MSNTTPPPRAAPLALWRIAQAFFAALHALFGAPEDVARAGHLGRAAHKQLALWLRAAQAILARLLLIEAAALPKPERRPARPHRRRQPRLVEHHADAPQNWRVALRLFPRPATPGPMRTPAARRTERDPGSAWPLAERYEALLRAYNDPAPYAARLACRLNAAPQRASKLFACPKPTFDIIGRDNLAALTQAAGAALDAAFTPGLHIRAPPPDVPQP